ncbi:MAG TPA: DUF1926 domain-containing protein [Syntrophorhabdaceae bacterium]|nr:DUF1926 domain-containing protein [Syntrophorhabdaceae bacterium]MDI9562469.1 DUF1926 domain-containing protein [Pseudomonadota bacterium]OQC47081.1 MAG: Alpha-amylase 1 [Deltaproteobacteria bacterium ADurb.Bin026]HQG50095.1 DUF1926 domain-containing protein [Syntrophorhabdaceae bacterium]HQI55880.1 DUF1926 domain-containing protein [Syntrophorhabdaceae bacterium]
MHIILCIHNHQPVGNMHFILEEAYNRSYKPFFEIMKDFPDVKINLHFSGYLLTWLTEHKPQYIKLLNKLRKRGQIEIVSGGMYEPILPLLTEEDGIAQIKMHMDYVETIFQERPKGMWLAERVYEPHIPKILNKAGVLYTLVDDYHFKAVGVPEKELYRYFVTEHEGHKLFIFPGLEFLRYAIPFKPIDEIDKYFRGIEDSGNDLAVFGDDGEKFGLWPGTYEHVYNAGWLKSFFGYLSKNKDWLKTVTFSEYIDSMPPKSRVYLNCNSYMEMAEWSLPSKKSCVYETCLKNSTEEYREFVKGGYFKYFLVKYDECNDMHKKMLMVTNKANKDTEAKKHVFMAQCNDSYWHGVFGGLYLPHLRGSVYNHLIEAEKILDPESSFVDAKSEDVNMDGFEEIVLTNNDIKAYFLLKEGGILYEYDYKPSSVNIMATFSRRYEGYHERLKTAVSSDVADGTKTIHDLIIAKEEGLDKYLHYDWYRRASLIDHVMGCDVTFDAFYKSAYYEPGDFIREPYSGVIERKDDYVKAIIERHGHYWSNGKGLPLHIRKEITLKKGSSELLVNYALDGETKDPFYLGVEFNFSFLGSGGNRYIGIGNQRLDLSTMGALNADNVVTFYDPYQNVFLTVEFDDASFVWTHPVEVVSLSEQGFERNYQNTMLMPAWRIDLSNGLKNIRIRLIIKKAN